jgi:transcriptional regulator with XRE-family HTH domain
MIGQNIKYLRKRHGLSQQELADQLAVLRSSVSDYERGHTQVSIESLIKISDIFNVSLDALLRKNLLHHDLEVMRNENLRVLAISINADNQSNIELVDTKAEAGYLASFADPEYIRDLPKISFPKIPHGTYRAFEINGDSMLPVEPGSIVICSYIEQLQDVKKGKTYVIISKSEGVVYKRAIPDFNNKRMILNSDNEVYLPYIIPYDEIAEVWQYYAHVSFSDTKPTFMTTVDNKIQDIHRKVSELHNVIIK